MFIFSLIVAILVIVIIIKISFSIGYQKGHENGYMEAEYRFNKKSTTYANPLDEDLTGYI